MAETRPWRYKLGWKQVYDQRVGELEAWELKQIIIRGLTDRLATALTHKLAQNVTGANSGAFTHAVELDLIPHWRLGNSARIQFTQKLELMRPPGGSPSLNHRYHAIPALELSASWLPAQRAAEISLETIYDWRTDAWIETKFVPLRLKFASRHDWTWSVFYVQNDKRPNRSTVWRRDHVFALTLHF
ncbi:MAG: hypothetical protein PHQ04_08725 [Opitutaceae bacterium]|nr:hypothetical protein [Opitutaceae bacterium]